MSLKVFAIVLVSVLQLSCCSPSFSYPVIADVIKIEVNANFSGQLFKEIGDSPQIDQIVRFIDERRSRWCDLRFRSSPVARFTLFFQNRNHGRAEIGFGQSYFVAESANGPSKMDLSEDEVRKFSSLIGVDENQLSKVVNISHAAQNKRLKRTRLSVS